MTAAPPPALRLAETRADYAAFGELCRQYVDWCRARYADIPWLVERIFGYQSLAAELEHLAEKYGPPAGFTLLAVRDDVVLAGGAVQRLDADNCEMKRVYVAGDAKGMGLGRMVTAGLIEEARRRGFKTMKLDTGDRLTEAQALYTSLGFQFVEPYHHYPDDLMPFLVFMEKQIADRDA